MTRRSAKALVAAWCTGLVVAIVAAPAEAQRRVAVRTADEEQAEEKHDGFSVRKEDAKFNDALQDFERYRDKKAWELAFRSLESLSQGKREGMVAAGKGFFVPSAQRVMLALATLPPDGKQAFRLFYDARAKQLLDQVGGVTSVVPPNAQPRAGGGAVPTPADEIATLREIYNKYFITSVGDRAADRLGDALFEAGDFAAAAAAWATILRESPDTALSKPRLHMKRAVALARGGQWEPFAEALRAVRSEFAGERVTVGGREVVVSDFLESLQSASPTTAPSGNRGALEIADTAAPLEMPQDGLPAWQIRLMDPALAAKLEQALRNNGWGRQMTGLSTHVPHTGTDGQRVYANWLGIVFAVDVRTGKLQWRNRKFSVLGEKFQNLVGNMLDVDSYSLTVSGKRLFVTGINLDRIQNYREPVRLVCMNTADGKMMWQSTDTGLATWNFIGKPIIVGDVLYAVARNAQAQDMTLLALGADKGELRWQLLLGTAQAGQNYRGEPDVPVPTLLPYGGSTMYVLTNNGALLSLDTSARKLNWAFTYAPPPISDRQRFWNGEPSQPDVKMAAAVFVQGSTLFLKEEDGDAVYAIDLDGPSLLWRRPIDRANTVARLPSGQLLSIGQDLGAIDPETRAMKWSASLPALATRLTPLVGQDRLMAFASRGIYEIDLTNGDTVSIVRGADRDSIGGTLFHAPGRLIAVSNLSITAYPTSNAEPISKAELEHLREFIDRPTMFDVGAPAGSE